MITLQEQHCFYRWISHKKSKAEGWRGEERWHKFMSLHIIAHGVFFSKEFVHSLLNFFLFWTCRCFMHSVARSFTAHPQTQGASFSVPILGFLSTRINSWEAGCSHSYGATHNAIFPPLVESVATGEPEEELFVSGIFDTGLGSISWRQHCQAHHQLCYFWDEVAQKRSCALLCLNWSCISSQPLSGENRHVADFDPWAGTQRHGWKCVTKGTGLPGMGEIRLHERLRPFRN